MWGAGLDIPATGRCIIASISGYLAVEEGTVEELMQIGQLGRRLGVNPKTIRYYEKVGLLPEPDRSEAGYRLYGPEDEERLRFILRAKALDFSLREIGEILAFREQGQAPCPYVLRQLQAKVEEVDHKIGELQRLRAELLELQVAAASLPADEVAARGRICHIIENRDLISVFGST